MMKKLYTLSTLMLLFGLLSVKAQLLNQSFDGTTFPPTGWVNVHSAGNDATAVWNRGTANTFGGDLDVNATQDLIVSPHSGAGMAAFQSWVYVEGNMAYLASPAVNLSAAGPQRVSFWMYRDTNYVRQDNISVYINTGQNLTGATFLGRVIRQSRQAPVEAAAGWYRYSFAIPSTFNTATNHIIFLAESVWGNNMFIDDVVVEDNPACTGTPVGGTASASVLTVCAGNTTNLSVTGATASGGITYQWQGSPAGANTFTAIAGATTAAYTASPTQATDYRLRVTCPNGGAFAYSTVVSVAFGGGVPANDEACGAIVLTNGGAAHCGNTACATALDDPEATCSTPNNTVWYKFTPTADGAYAIKLKRPAGGVDFLNAWIDVYTSSAPCPSLSLDNFFTCDEGNNVADITTADSAFVVVPGMVAGTDYFIRLDGFENDFGAYCISIENAPDAPGCTSNIFPANGATNISSPFTLTWHAATNADSYELFFGTENPPLTSFGSTADTSVILPPGGAPNTTYYWYVIPSNASGSAVGCDETNLSSYTTTSGPANDACGGAVNLVVSNGFCETPLLGTLTFSDTTAGLTAPACQANALLNDVWYRVTVPASGTVTIQTSAVNEDVTDLVLQAYQGSCGALTPIGCDDDGNPDFTPSSLHSRLTLTGRTPNEIIYIRVMPYSSDDWGAFAICAFDTSALPVVARGTACVNSTGVNIDSAFKYTWATLRTASGDIVAQVYPNGSILGNTTASAGIWPGVRVDGRGIYYLDRNVTVTPTTQPTGELLTRLYYTDGELAALAAAAGGATTADLTATKTNQTCATSQTVGAGGEILEQFDFGDYGADHFVDLVHDSYSTFYLHKGTVTLPIILASFNVSNDGKNNRLQWSTSQEINSLEFVVERSADSRNFTEIGRKAAAGNSSVETTYSFIHQLPAKGMNYYRIKMVDRNGDFKYSAVRAIRNLGLNEISVTPNPVKNSLKLSMYADRADAARVVITDMSGKAVFANTYSVSAGDNNIPVNTAALTTGSYIIKVQLNGDVQVRKFIKQ